MKLGGTRRAVEVWEPSFAFGMLSRGFQLHVKLMPGQTVSHVLLAIIDVGCEKGCGNVERMAGLEEDAGHGVDHVKVGRCVEEACA